MEEVKFEKRRPVWPWILLGLIVLAVIAYFLFFSGRKEDLAGDADTTLLTEAGTPPDVGAYVAFVRSDTVSMAPDHEYSSQALKKLIQAIQAKANQLGYDVQTDLARAGELADEIKRDPQATTHADSIRMAANIINASLQNMQQAHYPKLNNEMSAVSNAAAAIDPDKLALEQENNIQSFFREAANLLDKMK